MSPQHHQHHHHSSSPTVAATQPQPGTRATPLRDQTVAQLVADSPRRSQVFERHGLDFCCGGGKPLAKACADKGVDVAVVEREITALDAGPKGTAEVDWRTAPIPTLIDHIIHTHHDYLRAELPRIGRLVARVAKVHGGTEPRLVQLEAVVTRFTAEMNEHMAREEQVVFPMMARSELPNMTMPISVLRHEHDQAGKDLSEMADLTGGFTSPEWACNTYRAMIDALNELNLNTHQHVHKENNILFPRVLAITKTR